MNNTKFEKPILNLLGDKVIEYEVFQPDTLTMLIKDVYGEIEGKGLMEYIKEELEVEGFKDISFSFGDGHWMTVHNYKRHNGIRV